MSRRCDGFRVEVAQMRGNCIYTYVKLPGHWDGARRIFHLHKGAACRKDCEPNCQGRNEAATVLAMLVMEWADAARPLVENQLTTKTMPELLRVLKSTLPRRPS